MSPLVLATLPCSIIVSIPFTVAAATWGTG